LLNPGGSGNLASQNGHDEEALGMQDAKSLSVFSWAAIAMLLWGCAPIFEKAGLAKVSALTGVAVRSWVIAACLLILITATRGWAQLQAVDVRTVILLGVGGIMAGLLGQAAYYAALRLGEASRVVPLTAAFPLVTVALAIPLFREGLSLTKLLGALLVVGGVTLLRWSR